MITDGYSASFIRYVRTGDKVRPHKVTKAWVPCADGRQFDVVRSHAVPWAAMRAPHGAAGTAIKLEVPTRAALLANGTISEPGAGVPYLPLHADLTAEQMRYSRCRNSRLRPMDCPPHILLGYASEDDMRAARPEFYSDEE